MSRNHLSSEAYQMDMRSSPLQQNLDPSRSSSLHSQQDNLERPVNEKPHKLDLYSIPVFLLEVVVLAGLAYLAQFLHFQYHLEPLMSGFYCDDISYRQHFVASNFTDAFSSSQDDLTFIILSLTVPVVLILFCELVNSMFGALHFRKIRALCTCCKLHSITRRSIRFCGAYALGFFLVMISCDLLSTMAGQLRPFFAQYCPAAYTQCLAVQGQLRQLDEAGSSSVNSSLVPASSPISSRVPAVPGTNISQLVGSRQVAAIAERHWIDLTGQKLSDVCQFSGDERLTYGFEQLARSWPSFPAAIVTYACLFTACYLSFVGTARPFRIITCILVASFLLAAAAFDVNLVKHHFNHWGDVSASAILALVVVFFILLVYLNRFRDTHYYENQKLFKSGRQLVANSDSFKGYSMDGSPGHYNLDKINETPASGGPPMQNGEAGGPNAYPMRYFQIPRANYRSAPRPLSSMNQM